jgi:hypothetical protein
MTEKKIKILILPAYSPYPPDNGGSICTYGFIDTLRSKFDFTILIPSHNNKISSQINELINIWPEVNVLKSNLYDEDIKTLTFIQKIKKWTYFSIKKIAIKLCQKSKNVNHLNIIDYTNYFKPYSENYISKLKEIVFAEKFDIIQVQLTKNLNLVTILPEKTIKIFEQIESKHDVLKDYTTAIKTENFYADYLIKNAELIENNYIRKFDAVFTLNELDLLYIKKKMPGIISFSSPFGILDKEISAPLKDNFIPTKIVFSGNEEHYPNLDALNWYLDEVHEKITIKYHIKLVVTGNWNTQTKKKILLTHKMIEFVGIIPNYSSLLKNSIMVVPIRIGGGGMRTKIIYAMGNNAPVVSTSIGAFGIEIENNKHLLIANTADEFYSTLDSLFQNSNKAQQIIYDAYKMVINKYSQTATSKIRGELYIEIINRVNSFKG